MDENLERWQLSDKRMDSYIRQKVLERDGYTCRYCGSKDGPFHADHVYPWSKGGETSLSNMVTACEACNTKKHNKIGIWPMPIGYWDEHEKISEQAASEVRYEGAWLLIGLLSSGAYLFILSLFPDYGIWTNLSRVGTYAWFGLAVYCAIRWIVGAFGGSSETES